MEGNLLEEILAIATAEGPGLNSRYFVIFKAIYMAEVGNPPNMEYWPAELAIASFNLDTGHASNWWTLVDVGKHKNVFFFFYSLSMGAHSLG